MPRIRLITSERGYRYIGHGHPSDDEAAVVSEHRLAAVAWGLLDGLGDDREIHHADRCTAHTAEENLLAVSRDDHVEAHVEEALARGETPPRWVLNCLPFEVRNDLVDGDGQLRERGGEA